MSRPKFLADVMLGRLTKWLRILGYDTEYDNRIDDGEMVRRCLLEDRVALTSDRRLIERRALRRWLLIESQDLFEQIGQVLRYTGHGVDPRFLLTRCLECNAKLETAFRDEIREKIPPYVYATQPRFKRCPECGRIYWGGTHKEQILKRLGGVDRKPEANNDS